MLEKIKALSLAVLMAAAALTSCGTTPDAEVSGTPSLKNSTEITLNGDTAVCDSQSVYITEDRISITSAGTYVLSGTLNDGQIYVDCVDAGKITLVLNNASITNNDGACIYIKKAQQADINLMEGTTNTLTDSSSYTFDNPEDDEPDAALFSKEDLYIDGNGTLNITANYMNGLVSKDALIIESGNIVIDAANHGIKGKDYLRINGGNIDVTAAGDGIKSTNTENDLVGYIEINGGTLKISSEDEAIQAVSRITVKGGESTVSSTNNGIRCTSKLEFIGGTVAINAEDTAIDAADVAVSEAAAVTINGTPYNG